jgi:hypothetical protein
MFVGPQVPVIVFVGLLIPIVMVLGYRVFAASRTEPAQLAFLPPVGKLAKHAGTFNDCAVLRGVKHQLLALRVIVAKQIDDNAQRVCGLQTFYQMDGCMMSTPRHEGTLCFNPDWRVEDHWLHLSAGENVCMFALYFPRGSALVGGADAGITGPAALRIWTEYDGQLNPRPREFGRCPPVGDYEVRVPDSISLSSLCNAQVVAFHGSLSQGLQQREATQPACILCI